MSSLLKKMGIAVLLLSCLATSLQAQKIDREKLGYFNYQQLPASNKLANAQYFLIKVEVDGTDAYRRELAAQTFDGGQFKMATADDNPDFTIEIREGTYTFSSPEKQSYTKDEERFYYYTGSVNYHLTIEVTHGDGTELFRDDVTGSEKIRGSSSGSLSVANDYYVKQKSQAKQDVLVKQVKELEAKFHNYFSKMDKTVHLNHILIKEKKYKYPEFNRISAGYDRIHSILNASMDGTDESQELIQEAIQFFTAYVKDATPTEEKSQKNADVTAAAYYNLGIAHFFGKNYADAKQAFEAAASYNKKIMYDVKNMAKICADLASRGSDKAQ